MPEQKQAPPPRGFWSGTLSFGLVSVPVSLFPATRGKRLSLRMVDDSGQPLQRVYFCSKEDEPLTSEDIVRGYEVEKNRFVVVTDEELEAVAPDKSREIDLERFVDAADIDPMYFERGYYLAPGRGGARPYRLLARAMEEAGRAGVATFVMRGKVHLVAILAEHGLLRAETLRFHDELRSPEDVGLPQPGRADAKRRRAMERALGKLRADSLDESLLADTHAERLQARVQQKLKQDRDVRRAAKSAEPSERESAEVIDLMQILKRSVKGEESAKGKSKKPARRKRPRASGRHGDLAARTRTELYDQARRMKIAGRSDMTKQQLIDAIRRTG